MIIRSLSASQVVMYSFGVPCDVQVLGLWQSRRKPVSSPNMKAPLHLGALFDCCTTRSSAAVCDSAPTVAVTVMAYSPAS